MHSGILKSKGQYWLLLFFCYCIFSCKEEQSKTTVTAASPDSTHQEVEPVKPADPPANFKHQTANVNGVKIHYVIGGTGDPLVLVHGFGQNWYMWNRLLPELSKHFTVIAPDLRGVGESDKPADGYDKKTMAIDIHELVKTLGYKTINLAGHDIGLMVAYAYAAQFGDEVNKMVLMDAFIPGVEPIWSQFSTKAWWFGFFSRPVAGRLVEGRAGMLLEDFWPQQAHVKNAFTKQETDAFIKAYSRKGSTTGSFQWFGSFAQDVLDDHEFIKHKLAMPVLVMGGEFTKGPLLEEHIKMVAENVTAVQIKGAGHWLVQEQTQQVLNEMKLFFGI